MAVVQMVSPDREGEPGVEKISNYPGHEEGRMRHGSACPHVGQVIDTTRKFRSGCVIRDRDRYGYDVNGVERGYDDFCDGPMKALYMETSYVGKVVMTGERNMRDDSDFYAWVIDSDSECGYKKITYASTRAWTYPNVANVDATKEEISEFHDWQRRLADKQMASRMKANAESILERGRHIKKGDTVEVVKGRKVPVGTKGVVLWAGEGHYGKWRIKLTSDGEELWTSATNCVVA